MITTITDGVTKRSVTCPKCRHEFSYYYIDSFRRIVSNYPENDKYGTALYVKCNQCEKEVEIFYIGIYDRTHFPKVPEKKIYYPNENVMKKIFFHTNE